MNLELDDTIQKTRQNIEAAILYELGMLYAPDEIGNVTVSFDGPALGREPGRKLSVQVQLTVNDPKRAGVPQHKPSTLWVMR